VSVAVLQSPVWFLSHGDEPRCISPLSWAESYELISCHRPPTNTSSLTNSSLNQRILVTSLLHHWTDPVFCQYPGYARTQKKHFSELSWREFLQQRPFTRYFLLAEFRTNIHRPNMGRRTTEYGLTDGSFLISNMHKIQFLPYNAPQTP